MFSTEHTRMHMYFGELTNREQLMDQLEGLINAGSMVAANACSK